MKKLIGAITVLLIMIISIGKFHEEDDVFLNYFLHEFDTTINITSNEHANKNSIIKLEGIAQNNNISFIKSERKPMNGTRERQTLKLYIYLNDVNWFQDSYWNIKINKKESKLNKFSRGEIKSLLTRKKVQLKSFEKMNEVSFSGDYHVRGTEKEINEFVKEINRSKEMTAVIDKSYVVTSGITWNQVVLYMILVGCIISIFVVSCILFNNLISKELAVEGLLGYNNFGLSIRKTIDILLLPSCIGVVGSIAFILLLINAYMNFECVFLMKDIYVAIIKIIAVLFFVEWILLYRKIKSINLIKWLKGYRKYSIRNSKLTKIIVTAITIYFATISVMSYKQYISLRGCLENWRDSKHYTNTACTWSWAYVEDDDKFNNVVAPKLNKLWNQLDNEGGILFFAPNPEYGSTGYDDKYMKDQAFYGKYAYVNDNYLRTTNIVDISGNKINRNTVNENEWIIYVPDDLKVSKKDKAKIRDDHRFQSLKKENLKEKYIFIKSNQETFSYDTNKRIDRAKVKGYVLVAVRGSDMSPYEGVKLPVLVNGQFHPYVLHPEKPYDEIKNIAKKTQAEQFILYSKSVYNEVVDMISSFKIEFIIYLISSILLMIILFISLKLDNDTYYYKNRQKIAVSNLLGYRFYDVHKNRLASIIKDNIASLIVVCVLIMYPKITRSLDIFEPRDGWVNSQIAVNIVIGALFILICSCIELILLLKNENMVTKRLREGN